MEIPFIPLILSFEAGMIFWGREERTAWCLSQVDLTLGKAPAQVIPVLL